LHIFTTGDSDTLTLILLSPMLALAQDKNAAEDKAGPLLLGPAM